MTLNQARTWCAANGITRDVIRKGSGKSITSYTRLSRGAVCASARGTGDAAFRLAARRLKFELGMLERVERRIAARQVRRQLEEAGRK